MAMSNQERVGKSLEYLRAGLAPFVEREFTSTYKEKALQEANQYVSDPRQKTDQPFEARTVGVTSGSSQGLAVFNAAGALFGQPSAFALAHGVAPS